MSSFATNKPELVFHKRILGVVFLEKLSRENSILQEINKFLFVFTSDTKIVLSISQISLPLSPIGLKPLTKSK